MTTLDDLARVERELRDAGKTDFAIESGTGNYLALWADTIAAYIAAQRERDDELPAVLFDSYKVYCALAYRVIEAAHPPGERV